MIGSPSYSGTGSAGSDQTHALFGQAMGYVAAAAGFFALGAYLGRHLSYGWAFVGFIAAFACLISMNFAVRQSGSLSLDSAPLIAASIFLDALNVFQFFLRIFSGNNR